jgi:hypothetical protein
MIKNLRMLRIEPDRRLIGDEMDFVASGSELNSQLCADHATATVSWITGDSYFQTGVPLLLVVRFSARGCGFILFC